VSLGIDPLSENKKICNLNCIYCQLGKTIQIDNTRREFVPTKEIIEELKVFPLISDIDYVTFSGRGEPTLAKNLGELIKESKRVTNKKIAVITNATLIDQESVCEDLAMADYVLAKLDAHNQKIFDLVDVPESELSFKTIVDSLIAFRKQYKGKLAIEIMFIGENKNYAKEIAGICREIGADEIQINTPLRACAVKALSQNELEQIKTFFLGLHAITVYERQVEEFDSINKKDTIKRHGNYKKG